MAKERVLMPIKEEEPSLFPEALRRKEEEGRKRSGRPVVGVALSGGGIRSATLSLGFFQGLARQRLVSSIDYLSTVSGGGYFGGFFGHLLQRQHEAWKSKGGAPPDLPDRVLREPATAPLRYLRENGRYLSPNGSGDTLAGASVALRNWFAVITVIGLLALLLLTAFTYLRFASVASLPTWITTLELPRPLNLMSPVLLATPIAVLVLAVPPAWAYWLVPDKPKPDSLPVRLSKWLAPAAGAVAALWLLRSNGFSFASTSALRRDLSPLQWSIVLAGVLSTLTIARYAISVLGGFGDPHRQRRHLSRGLTRALVVVAVLVAVGVVDSIGQNIALLTDPRGVGVMGVLATVGGILRKQVLGLATRAKPNERPPLPTGLLIYASAFILIVGFLGIIAAVPHLLANEPSAPSSPLTHPDGWRPPLLWLLAVTSVLVLAVSRIWSFLNRSSLHAIYEARLRRAYLGASNPKRLGEFEDRPAVTEPDEGDGMTWQEYDPSKVGGPIHLINVTVNETVDGKSHIQQRDRKGMGLAVGPAGISVGATHHALWEEEPEQGLLSRVTDATSSMLGDLWKGVRGVVVGTGQQIRAVVTRKAPEKALESSKPFRVFPSKAKPERLDVGQWIAISGGAVSTGLGARTNVALSLLTGFFNVRLGYWWASGVNPNDREGETARTPVQHVIGFLQRRLPVQFALLDEWLARFPGVARRDWYLTDGGHFENLGGYELIRRRLPFIVVCDNEQDRDYQFDGLANLVRKARTDLNAEITFLSDRELARDKTLKLPDCIGSLDSLRRGRRTLEPDFAPNKEPRIGVEDDRTGFSLKHAALARIKYGGGGGVDSGSEGWLLYIKPSLDGDESIDVLRYHTEHPDFPQEPTSDQFFAEAQWESYRKLGEHLALKVFDTAGETSWIWSLPRVNKPQSPVEVPPATPRREH